MTRLRDLGVAIGRFATGPENAITDVAGVRVGHVTKISGEGPLVPGQGPVRTGVTAIIPADGDIFHHRVFAGNYVLNGAGEMMGLSQVDEWGLVETPILLTNTMSVGRVADAAITWLGAKNPTIGREHDVVIPIVAECDDSYLNDALGRHITEADVWAALDGATGGPVAEGCVGAGTGMQTFDFAGAIGTSSRRLPIVGKPVTIGALVLSNFGARERMRIDGIPVGRALAEGLADHPVRPAAGSIVVLVAIDAPLSSRQLSRVCRRAAMALGRVGGFGADNSGEFVLGWSTANRVPRRREEAVQRVEIILDSELDPLFEATLDVVEEAIFNGVCAGRDMVGYDDHRAPGLPIEDARAVLARFRVP